MANDLTDVLGVKVEIHDEKTPEEIMADYYDKMWLDDKHTVINENTFALAFKDCNELRYNNGLFYTRRGKMTEESIAHDIWESIADVGIARNVENTVKKLVGATKLAATVPALKTDENIIPFANGDFRIREWEFHGDYYSPVPYRLRANLLLDLKDTPYFSKWLDDLFEPDDQKVMQEYLGYCLVPTTKAQKALFLLGEGGAGKSGLGVILEAILGDAELNIANTQEFLQDKFKLPELEHKLVLYDDDLDGSALTETGLYKKLITNTLSITADRKYGQPFKLTPRIKLVACCNKMLSAMYDNTTGFYRRLLPVVVKPIAPDFKPDLQFYDHLAQEAEGIAQWALVGLRRLIDNNWVLSESDRTKSYMTQKQSIDNPLPDFMGAAFDFSEDYSCSLTEIMSVYEYWCRKNNVSAQKPRAVQLWLADNAEKYRLCRSSHIKSGNKEVRGYEGLRPKSEWVFTEFEGEKIKLI